MRRCGNCNSSKDSGPPATQISPYQVGLKGVVHITGGGMPDNIPRVIPKGLGVQVSIHLLVSAGHIYPI